MQEVTITDQTSHSIKADVSRLFMPRLNWGHFAIIFFAIVPNAVVAYYMHSWAQGIAVVIWLISPRRDKQFGNGKKYYWMRQMIFIVGTIIVVMLGVA